MNLRSSSLLLFLFFITATSCRSLEPSTWQLQPSVDNSKVWDTGRDPNGTITAVNCISTLIPNSTTENHLLTGMIGNKEASGNADRYVKDLTIECQKYIEFGGAYVMDPQTPPISRTLTSSATNFQGGSGTRIALTSRQYPVGVIVTHNRTNHAINLSLQFVVENNGILTNYTDPDFTIGTLPGYPQPPGVWIGGAAERDQSENTTRLTCDSQKVMTGMRLRRDNGNGKIRSVGIDCQLLTRNESASGN